MRMRLVILAFLCVACDSAARVTGVSHHGVIRFVQEPTLATSAIQGSFVSVIDSISIIVTDAQQTPVKSLQRKLSRREVDIPMTLDLVDGSYSISATVASTNDTVLFSGTRSFQVSGAPFTVDVTVVPRKPVLVVVPDTVVVTIPPSGAAGRDSMRVHNRGIDSLRWRIANPTAGGCTPRPCMIPSDTAGVLAANTSVWVTLGSVTPLSSPVTLILSSIEGTLPVVVRTVGP